MPISVCLFLAALTVSLQPGLLIDLVARKVGTRDYLPNLQFFKFLGREWETIFPGVFSWEAFFLGDFFPFFFRGDFFMGGLFMGTYILKTCTASMMLFVSISFTVY